MPQIKTVSVTYGRKINLGDFNSATIECTLWAGLKEGEDTDSAMHQLWDMATSNVQAKAGVVTRKLEAKFEEVFLGLPVETQEDISDAH